MRIHIIIAVNKNDIFSGGMINGLIPVSIFFQVRFISIGLNSVIGIRLNDLPCIVRRAIIANHIFEICIVLRQNTFNSFPNMR